MVKTYRNFKTNLLSNGVMLIGFDNHDKPVNILSSSVLEEFAFIVEDVLTDKDVKGVVLLSLKKNSFIVGADINEVSAMASRESCKELVGKVHKLFHSIEDSEKTFVAAIEGACLGGGLELALACNLRVASDNEETVFALPEVLLGIIPGFGGTQRLPRLIGITPALEMITSGKNVFPKKAIKTGLIDDLVKNIPVENRKIENIESEALISVAIQRALEKRKVRKVNLLNKSLGWPLVRNLVGWKAKRTILSKTDGHYPAPAKAVEAVISEDETPKLLELITSPLCKRLIDIFLMTEKMKPSKIDCINPARDCIGVLGAGLMGSQIAVSLVGKGYTVNLRDLGMEQLRAGMERILGIEQKDLLKRAISKTEFDQRLLKIRPTTDWNRFQKTSLVIEAIKEILEWKVKLLEEFEGVADENTVFATNTSSYTVAEIAQKAKHPERCIAMHFFNPVRSMKLVEIGVAEFTNLSTVTKAIELSRQLGKIPIVVRDSPGFLVNRILARYMIEAIILESEGVPVRDINSAAKKFGMAIDSGRAMGPLELIDYVGTDTCMHVIRSLKKLGSRVEDRPIFETIMQKQYIPDRIKLSQDKITQRLILPMVDEALRCLGDQIVKEPEYIDMAMLYGAGFPAFRGGLLKWAANEGLDNIKSRLKDLQGQYGDRFAPFENFKI